MSKTGPMSLRRTLVAALLLIALIAGGSAAGAVPSRLPTPSDQGPAALRERIRAQFASSFGGLKLPEAGHRKARGHLPTAGPAGEGRASDPFPGLAPNGFAGYASATVKHARVQLVEEVGRDVNIASAHAAHSETALPAWRSEIGRSAFPDLAAGASHGKALAAELSPPGSDEEDSELPLDPAQAKAPPTAAPVVEEQSVNLPPALENKALRAEASARALRSGCVLGSDLAFGRANADDVGVGNTGGPESPKPFLSIDAGPPRRAASQSQARTRLVPIDGHPNRFALLSETRQTFAPITFFKGRPEEITIEIAGEWILRAFADGDKGFVERTVERTSDDERPLIRIIRKEKGKPFVTPIGDLADLPDAEPQQLGNGLQLVFAEDARDLGGETGSHPEESGVRAAGALDILRLQTSDDPEDAFARVGHMEVAVAVPVGGATCPGIAVSKRSSQPTVDAGNRFSWLLDVSNPNDCVLDHVTLLDTTKPSKGLAYRVVGTSPPAKIGRDTVSFDGIGPIPTGGRRQLRIDVEVDPGTVGGRFINEAAAAGVCGSSAVAGSADNETDVEPPTPLPVFGRSDADEPVVRTAEVRVPQGGGSAVEPPPHGLVIHPAPLPAPESEVSSTGTTRSLPKTPGRRAGTTQRSGGTLPRTGGDPGSAFLGVSLCGLGLVLRRLHARRGR